MNTPPPPPSRALPAVPPTTPPPHPPSPDTPSPPKLSLVQQNVDLLARVASLIREKRDLERAVTTLREAGRDILSENAEMEARIDRLHERETKMENEMEKLLKDKERMTKDLEITRRKAVEEHLVAEAACKLVVEAQAKLERKGVKAWVKRVVGKAFQKK